MSISENNAQNKPGGGVCGYKLVRRLTDNEYRQIIECQKREGEG